MQEGLAKEEIFDSCLEGEQASLRSKNYTRAFQEGREQCTPKSRLSLSKLNQAGLTVPPGKFMHVKYTNQHGRTKIHSLIKFSPGSSKSSSP